MLHPYAHRIKRAQGESPLSRPHATSSGVSSAPKPTSSGSAGYRSAVDTGGFGKRFVAPKYYERPGIDPRLAEQGRTLEAEYERQFPYGDYTFSGEGYNARQAGSEAASLRTRFRNYEAQALGRTGYNPHAFSDPRESTSTNGPSFFSTWGEDLADVGRRSANRWGANYTLRDPDNTILDIASYFGDAGLASLAAAGIIAGAPLIVGGGSAGVIAGAPLILGGGAAAGGLGTTGAAVANAVPRALPFVSRILPSAGRFLTQGFPSVAQNATNAAAKYFGSYAPKALNYSLSSINPIPLLTGLTGATSLAEAIPAAAAAWFGTQGAVNNYLNAGKDVAKMQETYPDSTGLERAKQFGSSALGSGIALDPTSINPLKIGLGTFTGYPASDYKATVSEYGNRVLNSYITSLQTSYDQGLQQYGSEEAFLASPEGKAYEAAASKLANPNFLLQTVPQVSEMDVAKVNPGLSWIAGADKFLSANPFRAMGARNFDEVLQQDQAWTLALTEYANSKFKGGDPMSDPGIISILEKMSPGGRRHAQAQLMEWASQNANSAVAQGGQ